MNLIFLSINIVRCVCVCVCQRMRVNLGVIEGEALKKGIHQREVSYALFNTAAIIKLLFAAAALPMINSNLKILLGPVWMWHILFVIAFSVMSQILPFNGSWKTVPHHKTENILCAVFRSRLWQCFSTLSHKHKWKTVTSWMGAGEYKKSRVIGNKIEGLISKNLKGKGENSISGIRRPNTNLLKDGTHKSSQSALWGISKI